MRKYALLVISIAFPLLSFVWVTFWVDKNDWLWQSYQYSHENPSWDPYSSDVEADDLFNTNSSVSFWTSGWPSAWLSDSVLVRTARFLMRIAVMIAIPILLYWAIRVALAFGDKWKVTEALKHVWYMLWWLLLILFSVLLVLLITSVTRSSLQLFNWDLW